MPEDFEKKLTRWDHDPALFQLNKKIAKAMLDHTAPKGDELLLDYGTGLLTLEFRPHVRKIVAVDSSGNMLAFPSGKNSLPPQLPLSNPLHGASGTTRRNCPGSISSSFR